MAGAMVLALASTSAAGACDESVELLITEFMAVNNTTLVDAGGDHSDWIEIYNPCLPIVDTAGWYLTDDPLNLTKWQFPSVNLSRGEFLIVFASEKNQAVAGSELHTNFKLTSVGEYLALVKPDGFTIAQAFSPQFPQQYGDISYGLPQAASDLVLSGDIAAYRVPTTDDSALGNDWTAVEFDDSTWSTGPTGLGFTSGGLSGFEVTYYEANITVSDLAAAEAVIGDPSTQTTVATETSPVINYRNSGSSGNFGDDDPFPGTGGATKDDFVILATGTVLIPSTGPWTFGVNSDDGFSLQLTRDPHVFTSAFPNERGPADTLAVFNIPEAGAYSVRLVYFERGGGAELEFFAAQGSLASFSGAFELVGDTANGGLSVSRIQTDLQAAMQDVNSSLWMRVPFEVPDPNVLDLLTLRLAYEDGFVAYLNGTEAASDNAPAPVQWDSAALSDRPDEDGAVLEQIDLTDSLDLLQAGTNVLAVQGLNDSATNSEFLVLPEMSAAEKTTDSEMPVYFASPTPGTYNSSDYVEVSEPPSFSHPSGLFTGSFSLTLVAAPTAVIRYTLNGTDPSETNGTVYAGPVAVSASTRIRARAFEPSAAPSPIVTRLYTHLGADVLDFDSNLPIVVVDTFGGGIVQSFLAENLTSIIPTSGTRAAITDPPEFSGVAGIRLRGSSSLGFPKKQYFLETWDADNQDFDVSFLGMPAESDWILNGPYSDKTLMRNVLAYQWSNDIGRYAVRTRFVEMFLRTASGSVSLDDYVGVYVLMEKIKRDGDRVDITKLLPGDNTPPEVTGGYIIKKDRLDPGDSGFDTSTGQTLAYVEPKEHEITPAQADYLQGYLDEFESVLYGPDFADPVDGYAKYIDADSFIDHHILVEMTKNIDGFRLSTFWFKDRNGKLNMGPIWDYNLSLGNANYREGWLPDGWYHDGLSNSNYPWFERLFEDEEFDLRYADRWYAFRRGPFRTQKLLADIEGYAALLDEAQARNYNRWPILGEYVWPNWFIGETYQEEIDWMTQWLADRLDWMDSQFVPPPVFSHPGGPVSDGFSLTITAPGGIIYYTLDGTDPRLPGGLVSPGAMVYADPLSFAGVTQVRARVENAGTWSAINEATFEPPVLAYVNEVLPLNVTINGDEQGEFQSWIELYNGLETPVDLSGMYLTNNHALPTQWPIPAGTTLCSGCWLLFWADNEPGEGPLHTNFQLNPFGGTVALYDSAGALINTLDYGQLAPDTSYGRFPDGTGNLRVFNNVTPQAANDATLIPLILNEYNAVTPTKFLENNGFDTYWGRVLGNGGDWFELVVTKEPLDIRGWELVLTNETGGLGETVQTLVFSNDAIWSDLDSGTLITVSEDLPDDVSYDPPGGDRWINVQASNLASGAYITAQDFTVTNSEWQLTIRDATGTDIFGPAGEGVFPVSGIGSDEVFALEEDPTPYLTPYANYNDSSSSTFGSPNGSQNFEKLVCEGVDCSSLDGLCSIGVCNTETGQCEVQPGGTCGISGSITYYRENAGGGYEPSVKPVPDVDIDVDQDTTADTTTDSAGSYSVGSQSGMVLVTTLGKFGNPRASDENGAVTSLDAALISQHVVQMTALSPNQQIAADVSGNGEITSYDAARVAQFAVQMIDHFDVAMGAGSDWAFLRCDSYVDEANHDCATPMYSHDPLSGFEVDNFVAVLYGDVTGNWSSVGGHAPASSSGPELEAAARDQRDARRLLRTPRVSKQLPANAPPATLELNGWHCRTADPQRRELTLVVSNGDGIEALDLELRYDPDRLAIVDVQKAELSSDFQLVTNDLGDAYKIGMYGVQPLAGSGPVLSITVEGGRALPRETLLDITAEANEQPIPVTIRKELCLQIVGWF